MRILSIHTHFVSFHPARSGRRLSCHPNVKAKFVSSHHGDGVTVAGASVQEDFGRLFHSLSIRGEDGERERSFR